MIHPHHILHPLRSTTSLFRRVHAGVRTHLAQRQFRSIRRSQRNRCWCGGELLAFPWHPSYGVCKTCGCYVNRRPPAPEELKRLYSFDLYWHTRQQLKGHPAIESRSANDRSDGRIDFWLHLINQYAPSARTVIEVGCAHGVLLAELRTRGYCCIGVEPDERTAEWTRNTLGLDIRSGFFPDLDLPKTDLFLAFDVIEHCPAPDRFMNGAAQLLTLGGVAIIQTPVDRYDLRPPFGERFEAAFDDIEHVNLFTDKAMQEMGHRSGLEIVNMTDRLWLHHEICVFRKP